MKKEGFIVRCTSLSVTAFIITLLILAGPAEAFSLELNISETNPQYGDEISFIVSLNINTGERLPVTDLTLQLFGPVDINCKFRTDGSPISGCHNITIIPVSTANITEGDLTGNYQKTNESHNWGYGYGYGYGSPEILSYNITLDTSSLDYGLYETFFKAKINQNQFTQQGKNIIIIDKINLTDINSSSCAYETTNITLSANITGSVKSVWVETNISGTIQNHTTHFNGIYSANINSTGGQSLSWRFVAEDIGNGITYGNWNTMYIAKRTTLTIDPASTDGLNNWYVTEPFFTLENSDSSEIYYKWDSKEERPYNSQFGLENIPNSPPKESAGILELNYWSNTTCGIEPKQTVILKVDLTNPLIKDLIPENNSIVYNNLRPVIQAYIDEVYQSNSGIDKSSIIFKLDGLAVSKQITNEGLDAIVKHTPTADLSQGQHNVSVFAKDKAGRSSELNWSFEINLTSQFNLTVNKPEDTIYDNKRVQFNISTTEEVKKIEYINYNDNKPKYKTICTNCEEYGLSRIKTQTLNEGENNLTIRATGQFGAKEINTSFFIDSKKPVISKITPTRNKVTNGSDFYIKLREANLKGINLTINSTTLPLNLTNCTDSKSYKECTFFVNLSEYEGDYIEYSFEVYDSINTVKSKETRIKVDTIKPQLTVNLPENANYPKVPFNITSTEESNLEYWDNSDSNPRWKRICTNCNEYGSIKPKTKYFKRGEHDLLIRATDDAGNSDMKQLFFKVI